MYNDNDPFCVAWLRWLIAEGYLPPGEIDPRPIQELSASDVSGTYHFFAGIGGWPYALRLAGWPEDREVWTGSCPCQPFSVAGKRRGTADDRHLWPEFRRLIAEHRPATIFGEQVASKDGRKWLAGVRADLEALGYAVGAADLCAASAGAPHIRQRLFWVADTDQRRKTVERGSGGSLGTGRALDAPSGFGWGGAVGGLGDAGNPVRWPLSVDRQNVGNWRDAGRSQAHGQSGTSGAFWDQSEWLPCLDGKARRIEPGTFPLAHGVPARVGRLRGYGNAIVPQVAAEFVRAFLATI